jgi:hypothetical protein
LNSDGLKRHNDVYKQLWSYRKDVGRRKPRQKR